MFRTLETLVVRIAGDTTGYLKAINAVESTANRVARRLVRTGAMLTGAVGAGMTGAIHQFAKFDDAMTKSMAIMSGANATTRKEMEGLAREISRNGVHSATEIATAFRHLASAGFDAAQSISGIRVVEKFATAGLFDLADATTYLADAQSALGLSSADPIKNMESLTRVADVLVRANALANASTEQFSEALTNKAAAAAKLVGMEVEEVTAIIAAYAKVGVKGAAAGEKVNIVLRDVQNAMLKNTESWKALGLTVYDAQQNMLPFADILKQFEARFANATDEQKKMALSLLGFQDRSVIAVQQLIGMSDQIKVWEKDLQSAGGEMERVANEHLTSLSAQMAMAKHTIMDFAISIGEFLAPRVAKTAAFIQDLHDKWKKLNDRQKEFAVGLAAIAAAAGPVLMVLGAMHLTVAPLLGLFLRMSPWIIGIAGAIAGLVYLVSGPGGFSEGWKEVATTAGGFLMNLQENFGILATWIQENWRLVWADFVNVMGLAWATLPQNVQASLNLAMRMFVAFAGWLGRMFRYLWEVEWAELGKTAIKKIGFAILELWDFALYATGNMTDEEFGTGRPGTRQEAEIQRRHMESMMPYSFSLDEDLMKGFEDPNFLNTLQSIAGGAEGFTNPLANFKSVIGEAPKFNTSMEGFKIPGIDENVRLMGQVVKNSQDTADALHSGVPVEVSNLSKMVDAMGTDGASAMGDLDEILKKLQGGSGGGTAGTQLGGAYRHYSTDTYSTLAKAYAMEGDFTHRMAATPPPAAVAPNLPEYISPSDQSRMAGFGGVAMGEDHSGATKYIQVWDEFSGQMVDTGELNPDYEGGPGSKGWEPAPAAEMSGVRDNDPQKQTAEASVQQLSELKEQTRLLRQVVAEGLINGTEFTLD